MSRLKYNLTILIIISLSACTITRKASRTARFYEVTFDTLTNWSKDDHLEAMTAFKRSCKAILTKKPSAPISNLTKLGGTANAWQTPCVAAQNIKTNSESKKFFETWFRVYEVKDAYSNAKGKMTGYYEIELIGSRKKTNRYKYPIHQAPPNLKKIKGCKGFCHYSINRGALSNRNLEIAWVDNKARAFFLHIQGSGIIKFPDGKEIKVGYACQNGFPYTSLGSIMKKYKVTDQCSAIQMMDWLTNNPQKGLKMMEENQSYVFFREITGDSPIGGQGVILTPSRSIAIDYKLYPYGSLFWLETTLPKTPYNNNGKAFNKLMVAQDTGGAIKGAIRADIFFGRGKKAEALASSLSNLGKYYILVPKTVKLPKSYTVSF